ncbi:MAG: ABC transporter ATP-binding protein [Thermoproteota archaeon]
MQAENSVIVENLSVKYPLTTLPALENINFVVKKGEIIGIIGPTTSGKTTLCLCLKGLIPHIVRAEMSGRVIISGIDTRETSVPELSKKIGFVIDDPEAQLTQLTVEEEVAFGLENLGLEPEEIKERVRWALDVVGLTGLEDRAPIDLSGGQQQRLAIASVLAMQPEIIVLDEPTSNLDPVGKDEVFGVLQDLKNKRNITIIVAEHEVERLAEFSDKVLLIYNGKQLAFDEPEKVFTFEKLESIGVRRPQVTELFIKILDRSLLNFNEKIPVTLIEAYNFLSKILKGYP